MEMPEENLGTKVFEGERQCHGEAILQKYIQHPKDVSAAGKRSGCWAAF